MNKEEFPIKGKTDYNEAIYKYLISLGKSVYQNQDYNSGKHKGFAWNADSMWGISVSEAGSKPFYTNEFLLKCISPQYVKCIGLSEKRISCWSNYYEIGKIYKVKRLCDSGGDYRVLFNENELRNCPKDQFISSTKEEYDAQNQPKEVTPEYKVGDWVLVKGSGNGLNSGEEKIVKLIEKPKYSSGHINPDYYFTIKGRNLGTSKNYIVRKATTTEIYIADDTLPHKNFEKTINGKIPETVPGISGKTFWSEPGFPIITKEVIQKAKKKDPLSYSSPVKIKNKNKLFKF